MDEVGKEITMENSAFPNFDLPDSEIYHDSSYPLSLPSQPPDIRNWIASYVSEQSTDSTEGTYFHHSHQLNESETQGPFEDSRKRKLQEICLSPEKEQPDLGKATCATNFTLNSTMEIFRMNSTSTDSVVAKKKQSLWKILGEDFLTNCQKTLIDQSISPEMDKIDPRSDMLEGKTCNENLEKKCQEQSSNNSEQKKEDQIHHTEEKLHENTSVADFISPESRPKLHGNQENESMNRGNFDREGKTCNKNLEKKCQEQSSNNSEQKKEDQTHQTEEKLHDNTSVADFISPKSRPKLHDNQENESMNGGNFDREGHDSGGFRRLLIEKTNHADKDRDGGLRDTSVKKTDFSVDALPIEELPSGKWQCPRKRKPYVGPPLKQLRLEQWINRAS